jgi:hypothetical protein
LWSFLAAHRGERRYLVARGIVTKDPAIVEVDSHTVELRTNANDENYISVTEKTGGATSTGGCSITKSTEIPAVYEGRTVQYLDIDRGYAVDSLEDAMSRVEASGRREDLVQLVRPLHPNLTDLRIIIVKKVPLLHVEEKIGGYTRTWPASAAGDGFKRLVLLGSWLVSGAGRLNLLEDPESFQHYGSLKQVAKFLWQAANAGTQIVLTTHSVDLIRCLIQDINGEPLASKLAVFLMSRDGMTLRTKRFSGAQIQGYDQQRTLRQELGFTY